LPSVDISRKPNFHATNKMTANQDFITKRSRLQVVRTWSSLLLAGVAAGCFCFAADAGAQNKKTPRQEDSTEAIAPSVQAPAGVNKTVTATAKAETVTPAVKSVDAVSTAPAEKETAGQTEAAAQQVAVAQPASASAVQTEVATQATQTAEVAADVATSAEPAQTAASTTAVARGELKGADDEGGGCTVCHKNRNSITLPCNSVALRRHRAHGDYDGQCFNSTGVKE
jgi:cytoskeletal protein RodZ